MNWVIYFIAAVTLGAHAPAGRSGLQFSAKTRLVGGDSLVSSAAVHNEGAQALRLSFGGCPILLRVYRQGQAKPVWNGGNAMCFSVEKLVTLAPGERKSFRRADAVASILGHSLRPGRYEFRVRFRTTPGAAEIHSGEATLTRR